MVTVKELIKRTIKTTVWSRLNAQVDNSRLHINAQLHYFCDYTLEISSYSFKWTFIITKNSEITWKLNFSILDFAHFTLMGKIFFLRSLGFGRSKVCSTNLLTQFLSMIHQLDPKDSLTSATTHTDMWNTEKLWILGAVHLAWTILYITKQNFKRYKVFWKYLSICILYPTL